MRKMLTVLVLALAIVTCIGFTAPATANHLGTQLSPLGHGPVLGKFVGPVVGRAVGGGVGVVAAGATLLATLDADATAEVFNGVYRGENSRGGPGEFVGLMVSLSEDILIFVVDAIGMIARGEGYSGGPQPAPAHPGL